jgi:hypothetical protein
MILLKSVDRTPPLFCFAETASSWRRWKEKIVECINVFQVKKNTSSTANTGPTCSNCHRQERHNRLNCPYFACDTSFHWGAINRHPDEKAQLKEYEKQHQDLKKQISSLRNEPAVKEAATKSIQQRYVYQERQQLIESDLNVIWALETMDNT